MSGGKDNLKNTEMAEKREKSRKICGKMVEWVVEEKCAAIFLAA
jgi:hypothetical protein